MNLAVQKNHLGGQILYRTLDHSKKRRQKVTFSNNVSRVVSDTGGKWNAQKFMFYMFKSKPGVDIRCTSAKIGAEKRYIFWTEWCKKFGVKDSDKNGVKDLAKIV